MVCECGCRLEFEVVGQTGAGAIEDVVEDIAHGEDGRTRIDGHAVDTELAQFTAGRGGAFEYADAATRARQFERRSEAADPRTHYHDPVWAHRLVSSRGSIDG